MRGLVLLMVAVSSFFSAPGLSDLVLCLGNGGHLEIEYSVDGKCGTSGHSAGSAALHASEDESHCGGCTDISIHAQAVDAIRPTQGFEVPQAHAIMAYSGPMVPFHLHRTTTQLLPLPPPQADSHLACLRSTLLLI
jgi:hypothetical protein